MMTAQTSAIAKSNTVVIFENLQDMTLHMKSLIDQQSRSDASILMISCNQSRDSLSNSSIIVCIFEIILKRLMLRTRVGCGNPGAWLKHRRSNKEFEELVTNIIKIKNTDQLDSFLAHHRENIKRQIQTLIEIEKRRFALFVITHFQEVGKHEQPLLAGAIHRLTKGTPAYFSILSTGIPQLFRKDDFGEVGIQRNHDYIEASPKRGP